MRDDDVKELVLRGGRLLDDEDGPMLDVLKGFHGSTIEAPMKRLWRPDADRLELRFARFRSAG